MNQKTIRCLYINNLVLSTQFDINMKVCQAIQPCQIGISTRLDLANPSRTWIFVQNLTYKQSPSMAKPPNRINIMVYGRLSVSYRSNTNQSNIFIFSKYQFFQHCYLMLFICLNGGWGHSRWHANLRTSLGEPPLWVSSLGAFIGFPGFLKPVSEIGQADFVVFIMRLCSCDLCVLAL